MERVIVDTDSPKIADISRRYGAEIPYLRPKRLAGDKAQVIDAIIHLLNRLKKDEGYKPTHVMILQTTAPLVEQKDINACWDLIQKTGTTTALTMAPTHPRLYWLDEKQNIVLANKKEVKSTNIQAWRDAYILNGLAYIIKTPALFKEKIIITKNTKAAICDKWRSVDLDTAEDWALAEIFYKNRNKIKKHIKEI